MMTRPTATRFLQGHPSPLVVTLPCPSVSPFELYTKMASNAHPSFIFESGKGPATIGRYSFFATDPYQVISVKDDTWVRHTVDGHAQQGSSPFQHLAQVCGISQIARPPEVPPFFGGAVGYFSYDLVRQF